MLEPTPDLLRSLPGPTLLLEGDRVVWVNDAVAALVGEDPATLEGRALADLVDETDRAGLDRALASDGAHRRVRVHLGPDRQPLDLVVGDAADGRRWLSGQEPSEDAVRQQRLAALGQLSRLVAHEVRNPLAVIFQACRQLRRRTGEDGQTEDLLDILDEEAGRLSRLVDDLVDFAGPSQARVQRVDLSEVIHLSLMALRGEEGGREPALDARIPDEAALVQADPLLMRQALTHLLSHAFEHAGPGGHVTIDSARQDETVRIRVANDGPPLPPEVAKHVFEPFFDTKSSGSGLGLAVVRRLVEDQGGRVELDRSADHCAFLMHLPAAGPNL